MARMVALAWQGRTPPMGPHPPRTGRWRVLVTWPAAQALLGDRLGWVVRRALELRAKRVPVSALAGPASTTSTSASHRSTFQVDA